MGLSPATPARHAAYLGLQLRHLQVELVEVLVHKVDERLLGYRRDASVATPIPPVSTETEVQGPTPTRCVHRTVLGAQAHTCAPHPCPQPFQQRKQLLEGAQVHRTAQAARDRKAGRLPQPGQPHNLHVHIPRKPARGGVCKHRGLRGGAASKRQIACVWAGHGLPGGGSWHPATGAFMNPIGSAGLEVSGLGEPGLPQAQHGSSTGLTGSKKLSGHCQRPSCPQRRRQLCC